MKLIAFSNFFYKNEKCGRMESIKQGEVFELYPEVEKDKNQLLELFLSERVAVIDVSVIPQVARYKILLPFESADPLTRYYLSVTTLNKLEAIKRLNALEIFPVDQKRWLTPDSESMEPVQFFEENLNDNSKKKRIQV